MNDETRPHRRSLRISGIWSSTSSPYSGLHVRRVT